MIDSPYSRYIISPGGIAVSNQDERSPDVKSTSANFSAAAGFKKMGVHHVSLPPGARTSLPHAESLEEEFVFVISGHPHVWIDGFVYELSPNCAVGFPSGTGIAHNFINNSNENVELLVLGERTKDDNFCSFPINPEQEKTCGIWWADAPRRALGPHSGKPGPVQPTEVGAHWPECIVDSTKLKLSTGWHYAGDNETFSEYARLTNPLGLKVFGIGFESLAPGKRSSFPHAHKAEEEFVFVLSGTATIWMNGFVHEVKSGTGVAFVPGTNVAHTIINDIDAPLWYIVIGEASDEANEDRIFYPMHAFRNEQCKIQSSFWVNRPTDVPMGPHNGRPKKQISNHLCLRHGSLEDENLILDIFKKSPNYFLRVDGVEPSLATVSQVLKDRAKNSNESYRKEFLIVEFEDRPLGVVDLHIHHPETGIVYLGLLLVTEELCDKGFGRRIYGLVEDYVSRIHDTKQMRLGISKENDVSEFWKKLGFVPNGKTYDWKGECKTTRVIEFEKQLVKS